MQETELLAAAKSGDREALRQLLRQLESPLYRTAYYMLGHEQDALDATQEAMLKIYKNIHRYEQQAKLLTWAQRIVTNVCIDHLRKKKETVSVDEHEHLLAHSPRPAVEETVERKWVAEDVRQAIIRLPDHLRQVIVLRYIQDLRYREIADITALPLNTVKSHLFRARQQLQKMLQDELKGGGRDDM